MSLHEAARKAVEVMANARDFIGEEHYKNPTKEWNSEQQSDELQEALIYVLAALAEPEHKELRRLRSENETLRKEADNAHAWALKASIDSLSELLSLASEEQVVWLAELIQKRGMMQIKKRQGDSHESTGA